MRGMIQDKFEFNQVDIRKSNEKSVIKSKTFKNGVQGNAMNDSIENKLDMLSEGTIDNPNKINRTYS